jgi:hypothetical protein
MYSIVVQDSSMLVKSVYVRNTLREIEELLDILEPMMDSRYLITGEKNTVTFNDNTYSFHSVTQ